MVVVDVGDGADHSVVDPASPTGVQVVLAGHVAQQHDAITNLKRRVPNRENRSGEVPCCGGSLPGERVEERGF